eukprot:scaffold30340_cov31-Tisochrysis_lutea.AAC.2
MDRAPPRSPRCRRAGRRAHGDAPVAQATTPGRPTRPGGQVGAHEPPPPRHGAPPIRHSRFEGAA